MSISCMAGPSGQEKPRVMVSSTKYCYSDASSSADPNIETHMVSQLQSLEPNPEIYNLTTGVEMIGFPSKNLNQQTENNAVLWKGFFTKPGAKAIDEPTSSGYCPTDLPKQQDLTAISDKTNETMVVSGDCSSAWSHPLQNRLLVEDSSFRTVYPCEGNERPIHGRGLSLSLNSSSPGIGLQSFELGRNDDVRFGPSSSRSVNFQHEQPQMMQGSIQIRSSKYLKPAQELLNEFCFIEIKKTDKTQKAQKSSEWRDNEDATEKQPLYSLNLLELQKRRTKLLQMLEEVDIRYKRYSDQMKVVVSSLEASAGNGAAAVYSAMASTAMSKHFRCLKDGILSQIKATKKAIEEKDAAAPGTTKGETPRLRILDQTLRRQRAFLQMSMMESHPWRPQRGLPERSVSILRAWLFEHFLHPYPSDIDKHILARQTGLSRSQVSNWFINARVRLWKPMVEEMYLEDQKDNQGMGGALDRAAAASHDNENNGLQNQNPDQKPTQDQQIRVESESLAPIIMNNSGKNDGKSQNEALHWNEHQQHSFGRVVDEYGAMEFDFSAYGHRSSAGSGATVFYPKENPARHNCGSGGVSLTLGLHQNGGASAGFGLGYSPASQSPVFNPRAQMEDCETIQYSLLDGENPNLPYKNLMGAQLLRDLAG